MKFKNIYVINECEETMPHASSIKENIEEERRLFYVGISSQYITYIYFYQGIGKVSLKMFLDSLLKEN